MIDKAEDKFFKKMMINCGQVLLDIIYIPFNIKQFLPTDKIGLDWHSLF